MFLSTAQFLTGSAPTILAVPEPSPWIATGVSIVAILLAGGSFISSRSNSRRLLRMKATARLREAFDLMGGDTGIAPVTLMHDRRKLEAVKRHLVDARALAPTWAPDLESQIALRWGGYWLAQGKYVDAMREFEAALSLGTGDVKVASLNGLGLSLSGSGNYEEAFGRLDRALEINPEHPVTLLNLAKVYSASGDMHEGIRLTQSAIDIDPHYAVAYASLGYLLGETGRKSLAIGACEKAILIDPECVHGYRNLVAVLARFGHADELYDALEKAIALDPCAPDLRAVVVASLDALEADSEFRERLERLSSSWASSPLT